MRTSVTQAVPGFDPNADAEWNAQRFAASSQLTPNGPGSMNYLNGARLGYTRNKFLYGAARRGPTLLGTPAAAVAGIWQGFKNILSRIRYGNAAQSAITAAYMLPAGPAMPTNPIYSTTAGNPTDPTNINATIPPTNSADQYIGQSPQGMQMSTAAEQLTSNDGFGPDATTTKLQAAQNAVPGYGAMPGDLAALANQYMTSNIAAAGMYMAGNQFTGMRNGSAIAQTNALNGPGSAGPRMTISRRR